MTKKLTQSVAVAVCLAASILLAAPAQAGGVTEPMPTEAPAPSNMPAPGKADKQAVDSACAQDAVTAGCTNQVVGKGLLKCLHAYKKANKSFQFSEACKASMTTLKADRKAKKQQ
jgi:hypothetical protein